MAEAVVVLATAGVATPRVDAELLAARVLGVGRGALPRYRRPEPDQLVEYRRLVARRAERVPLQHLTGTAPFRWLDLAVGPGVFIPRPETELLVGWGLSFLAAARPAPVIVDLCSGSGAIALALVSEFDTAMGYAVEADPVAASWLARNVAALAPDRVEVIQGDATDPGVLCELDGRVDLVLCNPPYVPAATAVEPEVAEHDPATAVFGGADGLDVVRGVVTRAAALLTPGGGLGVEHDDSHGAAVPELLRADGRFEEIVAHRDLAGRPRFCTARRCRRPEARAGLADWRP
jgi:release factor glutamine methyltransferase